MLPFSFQKHLGILAQSYLISFLIASDIQGAKAMFRLLWDTQNQMTPRQFPNWEGVAKGHSQAQG